MAFGNWANLNNHIWRYIVEEINKCDQRKLATAQAANLRIHIMVHSGVMPNKCDQCNFSTHKTAILKKHMKIISGEKSNKCDPCKFSTTQAANLRIHIWKHHGENPKKCDLYRLNSVFTLRCQIQDTQQLALLRQKCFGINKYWTRDYIVCQLGKRTNARMYICAKYALFLTEIRFKMNEGWIRLLDMHLNRNGLKYMEGVWQ